MMRPDSSRSAWEDRPESSNEAAMDNDGIYAITAYNSSGEPPEKQEKKDGCCTKFGKGIRSIWATRHTEDTTGNQDHIIRTTLRELVIYVVFLIVICIVTFGMTSSTMYYYTKVMSELFLDSSFPDTKNTFRGMTTKADFWRFARGPLADGLYWETWYNGRNVTNDETGYIFYENKLLGVPRLRQLKVKDHSCTVHDTFVNDIGSCYEAYDEGIEDRDPFGKKTGTAWNYKSEDELNGSGHAGLIANYRGGGFVQDLAASKAKALVIMDELVDDLWITRGTRVVFTDFTVYNANINLFCVIRLLVEFPPTGGAIPSWSFRTVKLIRYVTAMDYFIMACECIFILFILYYVVEEALEIKKHKLSYFKSFWNILDILVILIASCCAVFNVYRTLEVNAKLDSLLQTPDQYVDFEFLSYWQVMFNSALAIMVFFAWVKIFKYISFNKTMTQLSTTLGRCAKDLAGFAIMFFIIFLAFAQLAYLIFGTQIKDFSSISNAIFTQFRIILGDFNFNELQTANRVLGPTYFLLYVFFVFFVLLNMFLAIINDTYSEVKSDVSMAKNEFEVADYLKKGYNKMLDRLNIKRDKIVDIQQALQTADMNNDKKLDFDEWRNDLKVRGYAEAEIEAVFSKYDLDGDRVLDESEQRKMHADLEGQKAELNKQVDDLQGVPERPTSARRPQSRAGPGSDDDEDGDDKQVPVNRVSYEEFEVLARRVDRMEHSIGSIVSKIDAVLVKLEAMERAKSKRRETMSKILDSITESDAPSENKRDQMEAMVRAELERWDSESSISPTMGASGGARARSRPSSQMSYSEA